MVGALKLATAATALLTAAIALLLVERRKEAAGDQTKRLVDLERLEARELVAGEPLATKGPVAGELMAAKVLMPLPQMPAHLLGIPAHPAELPAAKRAGQVAAAAATALELEQPGTMQSSPQPAPNQKALL
jgi:hypothetical protein